MTALALADRMRAFGHRAVTFAGGMEQAIDAVVREAQPGDLIMTLGAGNVWQAGDRILELLREGD
jgi:UDP-N-acetylmuramate--alanine ligase